MTKFLQSGRARRGRSGNAMLSVLVLVFILVWVVGEYMNYATSDARMTRRMLDYQKARVAAEAALEFSVIQLRDLILHNQFTLTQSALQSQLDTKVGTFGAMSKPITNYVYTTAGGATSVKITVDTDVCDGTITNGMSCRGLQGNFQYFTITAGARDPTSGVGAVVRLRLQAVGVYLIRYAIFYENDLEMFPSPLMTISGPVHANGSMYLGASAGLQFQARVTAVNKIYANLGKDARTFSGPLSVYDTASYPQSFVRTGHTLDSRYVSWISEALTVWGGNVLSGAHGIQHLRPPIAPVEDPAELIQRPRSTNSAAYIALSADEKVDWQSTETEKYSNRAALKIYVKGNGTYTATNGAGKDVTYLFTAAKAVTNGAYSGKPLFSKTAAGAYVVTNGCIDVGQTNFYDDHENKWLAPVDIYIDRFVPQLAVASTGGVDGLVYVTRDPPTADTNRMPVVRLRNGALIDHDLGLSIVTDCPAYIEGSYNVTSRKTALVAADAATMLSPQWQDAKSTLAYSSRNAPSTTTNNVVLMTGNTLTVGTSYNGGVENVLHFLEDWGAASKTYYYRGSIIDLWYSRRATVQWSGDYYTPPTRDWGYDTIYRTMNPPGMTRVFGLEEVEWSETTWAAAGF